MGKNERNEKPEVYALSQNGASWQITRRDFLKAAGLGTALMGVGMNSRFVRPVKGQADLGALCGSAPAHKDLIRELAASAEGKYLLSVDEKNVIKSWNFNSAGMLASGKLNEQEIVCTAFLDNRSYVIKRDASSFSSLQFPDLKKGNIEFKANFENIRAADIDVNGDIYGVTENSLFLIKYDSGKYNDQRVLYTSPDSRESFSKISVIGAGKLLFVLKDSGYGIYDIQSGDMQDRDGGSSYGSYAIMPGGTKALVCEKDSGIYRLVSLTDGSTVWDGDISQKIADAAVTPDGSFAILACSNNMAALISMQNGAPVRKLSLGFTEKTRAVVSNNGKTCAFSVKNSILFVSLPDFEVIGCPVDLKEMVDTTKGIEIQRVDPDTGQKVTYTLPCNAPIPQGAVCVCNCVSGSVCSCVGHVCSCVGYVPCNCDAENDAAKPPCDCDSDTSHYWYPN